MLKDKTEKQKMLAGELYFGSDAELFADHLRAQDLLNEFNAIPVRDEPARRALLLRLFARFESEAIVKPHFRCDYGYNISMAERSFVNFNCVFLDCNTITIGREVKIAPGVHIYTATHPLEATVRRSNAEFALPVVIEDGVWIGGGAVICPGVSIGANTVIGAGSVVTKSLPSHVLAVGNPCRVIRKL